MTSLITTVTAVIDIAPSVPVSTRTTTVTNYNNNILSAIAKEEEQQITSSSKISAPVRGFILNHIVNQSRSTIDVGFVDPNGTSV